MTEPTAGGDPGRTGADGDEPTTDPAALSVLEQDETVPPRPEEDEADALRSRPDPH